LGLAGAAGGFDPFVWGMLLADWGWMLELVESLFDACRHENAHAALVAMSFEGEAAAERAGPADGEFLVSLDGDDWCCWASSLEKHLTPKSSTQRMNVVRLVL
jgi:hypothetical protein